MRPLGSLQSFENLSKNVFAEARAFASLRHLACL